MFPLEMSASAFVQQQGLENPRIGSLSIYECECEAELEIHWRAAINTCCQYVKTMNTFNN